MTQSITQRLANVPDRLTVAEIRPLLNAILADNTAMRAAFVALTAKLDLDAGVSGTDYAALTNPAAHTLVA